MYNEIENYLKEMEEHLPKKEFKELKKKVEEFLPKAKEFKINSDKILNDFAILIQGTFRNSYTQKVIDPICIKAGVLYPLQALLNECVFNLLLNSTCARCYTSEKLHKLIRELESMNLINDYCITDTKIYRKLNISD